MKMKQSISLSSVLLPVDVFAHAGHVEWGMAASLASFEFVETGLVLAAISLYLVCRQAKSLKLKSLKVDKNQHDK